MNALRATLIDLHDQEQDLAKHLRDLSHRHQADHEIHHVTRDLADWSAEHVERIATAARAHGVTLDPTAPEPGMLAGLSELMSRLSGRHNAPGLLLLHDLQTTYLMASHCSLKWEMVAQVAQATRDSALLELASGCHPETLRQVRWCNTMIKILSPQILSAAS